MHCIQYYTSFSHTPYAEIITLLLTYLSLNGCEIQEGRSKYSGLSKLRPQSHQIYNRTQLRPLPLGLTKSEHEGCVAKLTFHTMFLESV